MPQKVLTSNSLSVLHNYFDSPTNLFSNLYLAKFLDTSTDAQDLLYEISACQLNS